MRSRRAGSQQAARSTVALSVVMLTAAWLQAPVARAYRPFDATDASVADTGELEFEFGPFGYLRGADAQFLIAPALIVNWGFSQGWELVLEGRNFIQFEDHRRAVRASLVDTALSVKSVLRDGCLQDGSGPSIAAELSMLLPTIHGESGIGAAGTLIVSQRWAAATVHLDSSIALNRAARFVLLESAIIEGPYDWVVRPVAELSIGREIALETFFAALLGIIWRVDDSLSFDLAARTERVDDVVAYEARVGLTWGFPLQAK
jgi:hypothetical protein